MGREKLSLMNGLLGVMLAGTAWKSCSCTARARHNWIRIRRRARTGGLNDGDLTVKRSTGLAAEHFPGQLFLLAGLTGKTLNFFNLGMERSDQPDPRSRGSLHEPRQRLNNSKTKTIQILSLPGAVYTRKGKAIV